MVPKKRGGSVRPEGAGASRLDKMACRDFGSKWMAISSRRDARFEGSRDQFGRFDGPELDEEEDRSRLGILGGRLGIPLHTGPTEWGVQLRTPPHFIGHGVGAPFYKPISCFC